MGDGKRKRNRTTLAFLAMAVSLFNSGTFPAVAAGLGQKRASRTNWLTVQPGFVLDPGGWRDPNGLSHPIFTFPSFQSLMLQQQD